MAMSGLDYLIGLKILIGLDYLLKNIDWVRLLGLKILLIKIQDIGLGQISQVFGLNEPLTFSSSLLLPSNPMTKKCSISILKKEKKKDFLFI